ncbi:AfsR/SARP family transcriptional regulator [Streptomyces alboniger]|uniref:AfsR/SARP family transcriptional regulator n=1 Tax=Streptomyces alboniger TaxID=132473 RepID=UPI0006E2A6B6|nr:BTAD domain-containing putative transcriptional regulator [Streptomyces alboniger]
MRYRVLGPTRAARPDGTPVPVGGARLRALLAALALRAGRAVPVPALVDDVWGAEPPADAAGALQALVGRLRRALGADAVVSADGGYRLDASPDDVDLFRFDRLTGEGGRVLADGDPAKAAALLDDALALWRGEALADLPGRTADAARWQARRHDARRARLTAALALGQAEQALPELTALCGTHPLDEPLQALRLRALRDAGRPAEALAAYEGVRRGIADRLGVDPGAELRALHEELLRVPPPAEPVPPPAGPVAPPARPAPRVPGNLRARLTSFVGREADIEALRGDLARARLVTLLGPGGAGKTRLSQEAAESVGTGFADGVWLAELAPVEDPDDVPEAVLTALGARETVLRGAGAEEMRVMSERHGEDPVLRLVEHCAGRRMLVILDNCEHVVAAAARLADELLARCPGLAVLATSREPLGIPGELTRPVEPLPEPVAVRLLAERGAAARAGFTVEDDPAAAAEICRRLDGLPLAIELAAARLRMLTPRQIADRLDDRFRLLTSGARTVLPRQQTLRAVVDWSWDLLGEAERTVLCEVSVFAGSWDLPAAEAVCTGPATELIGALVDKSLIVAVPGAGPEDGGMRYRLLETIHEYAAERAAETPGLLPAAARRHSAYFRALVERAEPLLRTAEQLPWIRRLETELDNIRAALQHSVETRDTTTALALALHTGWFWWLRNFRREGCEWMSRVLGLAPVCATYGAWGLPDEDDPLYWPWMELRLLHLFLVTETLPADARTDQDGWTKDRYVERVRAVFARPGPESARFPGLIWPFTIFFTGGTHDHTRPAVDQAVENCRRYGGDWELCVILMFRAHMAIDMNGNFSGVDEDLAELRALSGRVGDRWIRAQVSSAAGEAAMARSRHGEARAAYEEGLRLAYEVGAYAETPFLLARLAEISYLEGDREAAEKTLDEASTEADRYGVTDSHSYVRLLRAVMALDDGDPAAAGRLCAAARGESTYGTPPPQFSVAVRGVEARVTAAESGPAAALPELTDALREAVNARCSEVIVASLVDTGATFLSDLGDHVRAVRLLAVGTRLRGGHPRPRPEVTAADRVMSAATAALTATRYEAAYAAGGDLTIDELLRELTEAMGGPDPSGQAGPGTP